MADSNRPRPKPKPRPKPAAATLQLSSGSLQSSGTSSSSVQLPSSPVEVKDDDEMFMLNRKRTAQAWKKLDEVNKEAKPRIIESGSGSDSDENTTPRKSRKPTLNQRKGSQWQWTQKMSRLLSEDLTNSDESDGIEVLDYKTATPKGNQTSKRKRQERSRSRSITPPPALPLHQIQTARNLVRQTLHAGPRAPSPILLDFDETENGFVLDPELQRIAKSATSRSQRNSSQSKPELKHKGGEIMITVKWQRHPLNKTGREDMWKIKMNRDDTFHDLFEVTAEEAAILSDNLIVTYQGRRIFASISPQTLKLWGEAELLACDKTTYEYLRKNEPSAIMHTLTGHNSQSQVFEILSDDDDGPAPITQSESQESEAESESDSDKFRITLRSSLGKDITLTVRPATKCRSIIKAFLKKAGVADQYPQAFSDTSSSVTSAKKGRKSKGATSNNNPKLSVDGETMKDEDEIGTADLEDGDLVDVVGL